MSSRHEMITVSARKSSGGSAPAHKAHKGKKLSHMMVKPSANGGAVVEHHFERPDSSKENPYPSSPEPEIHTFKNGKETGKHIAGMMGASEGAGGKEAAAETEEDEEKNEDL